jgi:predicted ATP-grasp superfamily ATP-dependent carboligase
VPAIVADVGWVNGLAAIRSLGRLGVPVIAIDHRCGALGFRSRYALSLRVPDPVAEEAAFVDLLAGTVEAAGRPVAIFPTHDEYLNAIARAAERIPSLLAPFPDWALLESIQSKRFQLERARDLGLPTPRWADEPTNDLGFPVLVKPSDPTGFRRRFKRQAFRCESRAELDRVFADAEEFAPLVQELIPGGDEELYTLGSYVTREGDALGVFSGRKLRQTPPGVGTCRVGEAVWVDEVVEQGLAFIRGLGFHGLSQVEWKRDPRDGAYKLMEINPRLWQWHSLAAACGVDVTAIAYRHLTGEAPAPARSNGSSKRWAITFLAGTKPAVVRPPYVDAVFALDDPGPAVVQMARLARSALR